MPCRFRFLKGGDDQAVDPLIASVEGLDGTPAFRGLALAVFEDLALVDYGNRIPLLTFELVADEAPVPIGAILEDVSRGVIVDQGGGGAAVSGFAAYGSDQRSAIEELVALWGLDIADAGDALTIVGEGSGLALGLAEERGCVAQGEARQGDERRQEPARSLPSVAVLNYYEASRDYQSGQVRAVVDGGGRSLWRVDAHVVLDAGEAKQLINRAMTRRWSERDRMTVRLAPASLALAPGDAVIVPEVAGPWRVDAVTVERLTVIAELRRLNSGGSPAIAADPGRATSEPDEPIGVTQPAAFDLPALGADSDALSVTIAVTAAGEFRPVPVSVAVNDQPYASMALSRRAVLGIAATRLEAGPAELIDLEHSVEVMLGNPGQVLLHADDDALAAGANLALLGDELIQFGRAEALGDGRYRLSRLLRGRRGSEWAIPTHAADEHFLLIDPAALVTVALDPAMRGATISAAAHGVADDPMAPPTAAAVANGESLRPLAPAHLAGMRAADGSLILSWFERSRAGLAWIDGVGDPSPSGRTFEIEVAGAVESWTGSTSDTGMTVPVAALSGLGGGSLRIAVSQAGALAQSHAATIIVA